jgi:hypothetical protein
MHQDPLANLSLSQKDRLKHVELRLRFLGEIQRPALMRRFGIASAAASRDLALYKDLAPQNIVYDDKNKRYLLGPSFEPLFPIPADQVLSWLAEQQGDTSAPSSESLLPCAIPGSLSLPDQNVLSSVTRAIHFKQALSIQYHAISSGRSAREIVPFALLDTGLRWHVRAFDRKSLQFRDFVLTRIQNPQICTDRPPASDELFDQDIQWTRIVELELVPHPDQPHPEITQMDYGMTDGMLRLRLRAAIAGYALRKYSVDCSPDHSLRGPEYRLWLKDSLALYGVDNAIVAPGYQAPTFTKATS